MDNDQNIYGIKPMNSPKIKNLLHKKFFFLYAYGNSDNKGTNTRNVFIMKDKPIQMPKSRIKNLLSSLFILTNENTPMVTKQEKMISWVAKCE